MAGTERAFACASAPHQIIFEVADDAATQVDDNVIAGGGVIGVPATYPREEDPVVQRY